jgi:hypothetical protein
MEEDILVNIENTPTIGHPHDSFSSSRRIGSSSMMIDDDIHIIEDSNQHKRGYMDDEDMIYTNPSLDSN